MTAHNLQFKILASLVFCASLTIWAQTPSETDPAINEIHQGDQALAEHKYSDALKAFKSAEKLDHDSCVICTLKLAVTYVELKNWREAEAMADKALALATNDPQLAQAHNLKGHALLGQISQDAQKLNQAEEEFRAAVQASPSVPAFHLNFGLALLKSSQDEEGIRELQKFLELAPQNPQATLAREWIADPRRARGLIAPDFHITTAQGDDISPASLKGKIAVLDFWATWCPPCRAALPDLKDLVKKYPPDRFVLISVSVDRNTKAWHDYVEDKKMTWPQCNDEKGEIFKMFNLQVIPTYIVLGGDGSIITKVYDTDPQKSIAYRLKDILAKRPELSPN